MKPALALFGAVLLCASCVKRIAPSPGDETTVGSGVARKFGIAQELPKGTTISWNFGDGTPVQQGAQVSHVFPRAGSFTIEETVRDRDGQQRTKAVHVTVLRRSVPMAVPADVRGVFIAQQPWQRAKAARAVARRIGLGDLFDETAREVSDAVNFDATDAQAVTENGIDPDEGVALYTVPQDDEAVVLCLGISDEAKAEAALRKLLTSSAQPFTLVEVALPDGTRAVVGTRAGGEQRVGYLEHFGYLYLRTRGRTDPLLALASAAAIPEAGGLELDAGYERALQHVGSGDAVFYSPPPRPGEDRKNFLSGELGASAFAVDLKSDGLQVRLFGEPRNITGKGLLELMTPLKNPPDLAAQLPGGAAAFFKLSGEPQKAWSELLRALGPDGAQLRERARDFFGAEPQAAFLPLFTGNIGIGIYVDASSLLDAFLGEQVASLDKSTFVSVSEVKAGKDGELHALLDRLNHGGPEALSVGGATFWKLSDVLQVAARPGWLFVAVGGGAQHEEPAPPVVDHPLPPKRVRKGAKRRPPPAPATPSRAQLGPLAAVLLPEPGAHSLGEELSQDGLRGFDLPQDQLGWLDVQGVLRSLQHAADAQGGIVSSGVRLLAGRVRGVRDALFEARPAADGIGATLTVRFVERQGAGAAR